jgi:hypothetical protein
MEGSDSSLINKCRLPEPSAPAPALTITTTRASRPRSGVSDDNDPQIEAVEVTPKRFARPGQLRAVYSAHAAVESSDAAEQSAPCKLASR